MIWSEVDALLCLVVHFPDFGCIARKLRSLLVNNYKLFYFLPYVHMISPLCETAMSGKCVL
jgi:hypothetical protein